MHSLYDYLLAYESNKDLIKAYLSNKSIENYSNTNQVDNNDLGKAVDKAVDKATGIFALGIGFFIVMLLISLVIWIFAVFILVKYWNQLPSWAQVLGVIGVVPIIPVGPILTIIAVYIGKSQKPA